MIKFILTLLVLGATHYLCLRVGYTVGEHVGTWDTTQRLKEHYLGKGCK